MRFEDDHSRAFTRRPLPALRGAERLWDQVGSGILRAAGSCALSTLLRGSGRLPVPRRLSEVTASRLKFAVILLVAASCSCSSVSRVHTARKSVPQSSCLDVVVSYIGPVGKDVRTIVENEVRNINRVLVGTFGCGTTTRASLKVFSVRHDLVAYWREKWDSPDVVIPCWMVAETSKGSIELLSPEAWEDNVCDHQISDFPGIIRHELVHVYHHQRIHGNPDEGIQWFAEGLAVMLAGQLDEDRLRRARENVCQPDWYMSSLSDLWRGAERYGRAGSVVQFIAKRNGPDVLRILVECNSTSELLVRIHARERELIEGWRTWLCNM